MSFSFPGEMGKEISSSKFMEFTGMIWSQMNHISNQIFLCKYELSCGKFCIHSKIASVVGCEDWPSTRGLEVERIHNRLTVKCIATQETTEYVCKHSTWEGRKLNCTQGGHKWLWSGIIPNYLSPLCGFPNSVTQLF